MVKIRGYTAAIVFALSIISLTYLCLYTSTYEDVKDKIVSVLCLGCIKLEPKTVIKFRFDLAHGDEYPDFVIKNLSKGPIFLHFRIDVCSACEEMDPVIQEIFNIEDMRKIFLMKTKNFSGSEVTFMHINLDHVNDVFRDAYESFDISKQGGVPMYTVITLGYDRGFVKPCYATGYGFLEKDSPLKAKRVMLEMLNDAVDLFKRNREGFE